MLWFKISAVKLRRKITHTFFIHKTFGNYFSKSVHMHHLTSYFRRKIVPLGETYNTYINMKQTINERIQALRFILKSKSISAFIIPSTDPHLSQYVAPHWKIREWISGFTGSAGTVVILDDKAGLWTDSRYFLQTTDDEQ